MCDSVSASVAVLSHFVYTYQTHLCECQCRCVVVSFCVHKPNTSLCVTVSASVTVLLTHFVYTNQHISVCDSVGLGIRSVLSTQLLS